VSAGLLNNLADLRHCVDHISLFRGLTGGTCCNHRLINHVSTAVGYSSSSAGPVHFGLGGAKIADEIEVTWPSGTVQMLRHVQGDQILRISEPK
jgi:hypothetical protein